MSFREIGLGTLLSPTPVIMLSCADKQKKPNIITLAWVGTVCSDPPMISVSIRPERYSYDLVEQTGEFVVNLVSRELLKACDYCGVRSGRDEDKFEALDLHAVAVPGLQYAPAVAESPLYLGCKVEQGVALGSHKMYIGRIVSIGAQEELMDPAGRLMLDKADLIAYLHGEYYSLAQKEGFFGYSVARPEVLQRRMAPRED